MLENDNLKDAMAVSYCVAAGLHCALFEYKICWVEPTGGMRPENDRSEILLMMKVTSVMIELMIKKQCRRMLVIAITNQWPRYPTPGALNIVIEKEY